VYVISLRSHLITQSAELLFDSENLIVDIGRAQLQVKSSDQRVPRDVFALAVYRIGVQLICDNTHVVVNQRLVVWIYRQLFRGETQTYTVNHPVVTQSDSRLSFS